MGLDTSLRAGARGKENAMDVASVRGAGFDLHALVVDRKGAEE